MNRYDRRLRIDGSDVDVSRLIALSGSNVSSVDHHHYLGREIGVRLGCWRHHGLEIGSDTLRSIPHGYVIHRPTRQKHPQ